MARIWKRAGAAVQLGLPDKLEAPAQGGLRTPGPRLASQGGQVIVAVHELHGTQGGVSGVPCILGSAAARQGPAGTCKMSSSVSTPRCFSLRTALSSSATSSAVKVYVNSCSLPLRSAARQSAGPSTIVSGLTLPCVECLGRVMLVRPLCQQAPQQSTSTIPYRLHVSCLLRVLGPPKPVLIRLEEATSQRW